MDVDFEIGSETIDYLKLAEKEKLKPMELELRKLEDLVKDVIEDMEHLQRREEKMRNTNGNDIWITPGTCWILEYICFRDIALGVVLCTDTIRLFSSLLYVFLRIDKCSCAVVLDNDHGCPDRIRSMADCLPQAILPQEETYRLNHRFWIFMRNDSQLDKVQREG